jgi:hypothetical protein
MVDVKQAIEIAKQKASEMLNQNPAAVNLEEIERESYNGRDVWSITLSFPRNLQSVSAIGRIGADPLQYKRFLIDAESGEFVALKLREVASR